MAPPPLAVRFLLGSAPPAKCLCFPPPTHPLRPPRVASEKLREGPCHRQCRRKGVCACASRPGAEGPSQVAAADQLAGHLHPQEKRQWLRILSLFHPRFLVIKLKRLHRAIERTIKGATDEFVLDLVEQCMFEKQRIMHLVMMSRDEVVVSQAIELNEELHRVLVRHDALLSVHPTMAVASNLKEEEEEDAESLYRRLRKGKALPEDYPDESVPSFRPIPEDKMRRPLTI